MTVGQITPNDILRHYATGKTHQQIADTLYVSRQWLTAKKKEWGITPDKIREAQVNWFSPEILIDMLVSGKTSYQIADIIDRSIDYVKKKKAEWGITKEFVNSKKIEFYKEQKAKGFAEIIIAQRMGITIHTFRTFKRKNGLIKVRKQSVKDGQ